MKRELLSSTLLCCAAVLVSTAAFGQPDNPCGRDWKTPLQEISGTISKVYIATMPGTQQQGLHLDVAVDGTDETTTVHVFPKRCIKNNPDLFKFEAGEKVTAAGSDFGTQQGGRHQNLCAQSIPSHNLPDLRDEQNGFLNQRYCIPDGTCEQRCRSKRNYQMCMQQCTRIIGGNGPRQRGPR